MKQRQQCVNYGHFKKILSKKWGGNFDSTSYFLIIIFEIVTAKFLQTIFLDLELFELKNYWSYWGKFQVEVFRQEFPKLAIVKQCVYGRYYYPPVNSALGR